ncbi:MAG TPA: hypothetical protein ENN13_02900 [Candidatus Altiarchaeales archaeon]|nr:hypothetical protein [Candidatus Altiarchaeales archaeon]
MSEISDVTSAVEKLDGLRLRELAGAYSDRAALSQSQHDLKLSLITYCTHKIYNKIHFKEKVRPLSEKLADLIGKGDLDGALSLIEKFDADNGLFQNSLVEKARVKIGTRLYTQGISVSQAASLLGVGVSDIQDYVGDTKYHEQLLGKSVKERFSDARKIFGGL